MPRLSPTMRLAAALLLALVLLFGSAAGEGRGFRPRPAEAPHVEPHGRDPVSGEPYRSEEERFAHLPPRVQLRIAREVLAPLYASNPESFRRAEPFLDNLRFLRVRLPNNDRAYDALLKEDMRTRYQRALAADLTSAGIFVLAVDFSTSPTVEAEAQAAFRRHIPAWNRRLTGGLANLRDRRPNAAVIREGLKRYQGMVLILVGHIDTASHRMSWTRGRRKIDIDLELWASIAAESGVSLIPYGCYSSRAAPIGSPYAVNSAQVARGIGAMLAAGPNSFGQMFQELTRERHLTLDLDPFQAALSQNRIDIVAPDQTVEGEIRWNPNTLGEGMVAALLQRHSGGNAVATECGAAADPMVSGQCMDAAQRARDAAAWAAEAPARAVDAANVLGEARQALTDAERARWGSIALFAAAMFAAAALLSWGARDKARAAGAPVPSWGASLRSYCPALAIVCGLALALALPGWRPATMAGWGLAIILILIVPFMMLEGFAKNDWAEVRTDWPALVGLAIAAIAYLPVLDATPTVAERRAGLDRAREGRDAACRALAPATARAAGGACAS